MTLSILKTYKLFINGAFPRSESGRSFTVQSRGKPLAHLCRASRKDLRDAVETARSVQPKWAAATCYNRGQILYRLAEMLQARSSELAEAVDDAGRGKGAKLSAKGSKRKITPAARTSAKLRAAMTGEEEASATVDRLVHLAGWADKFSQVIGCQNPVTGPYYNFSVPEPTGVVGIIAPDAPALLGLVSLIGAAVVTGNTVVALASETNPIPACLFTEVCATSDVPAGVVNVLTGFREELVSQFASHREINSIAAASLSGEHATALRAGAAENLKRVAILKLRPEEWAEADVAASPRVLERFVEIKTIWHPSAV